MVRPYSLILEGGAPSPLNRSNGASLQSGVDVIEDLPQRTQRNRGLAGIPKTDYFAILAIFRGEILFLTPGDVWTARLLRLAAEDNQPQKSLENAKEKGIGWYFINRFLCDPCDLSR